MYGIYNTFKFAASPGYGWDGVIVATLAKLNPAFVPVAALFIAYIRVGADILNRSTNIPQKLFQSFKQSLFYSLRLKHS